jgi:hypothetical protein
MGAGATSLRDVAVVLPYLLGVRTKLDDVEHSRD